MFFTQDQLRAYEELGYVLLPDCFSREEIALIKSQLPPLLREDTPKRVIEKEGEIVRSVYGCHQNNDVFNRLTRLPRIVNPVMQILGSEVYVYQFKINVKAAFAGDMWAWHQDYIFWQQEDGMPSAQVVNVVVFLDEINEFNGPLFIIPGSHKEGVIEAETGDAVEGVKRMAAYKDSPGWIANLTANLKFSLGSDTVGRLVSRYGLAAPKGPAGSALFFHSNIVHASPNNISPFNRTIVIISLNSVNNLPVHVMRPDFLVSRDIAPIAPLPKDALLA
jgi:hypothetical protein